MADKNFKSYETVVRARFVGVELRPADPTQWNDTMKVWKCFGCVFDRFDILGAREDCIDVGQKTNNCVFSDSLVEPTGQYVVTCKGESNNNLFTGLILRRHGRDVDFEFGNWHSYAFGLSTGNTIHACRAEDGKPVTYCYRWGCKPTIVETPAKHLWWRSIGLTVYWWAKYIWHVKLGRPDNF